MHFLVLFLTDARYMHNLSFYLAIYSNYENEINEYYYALSILTSFRCTIPSIYMSLFKLL